MSACNPVLVLAAALLAAPLSAATSAPGLREGAAEVVIADVREPSCSIVLGPHFDGRFSVRNARQALVAELRKAAGSTLELWLEPGSYDIHYEQESRSLDTTVSLQEGDRKVLEPADFQPPERATQEHGAGEARADEGRERHHHHEHGEHQPPFLQGRTRVEIFGGFTDRFMVVEGGNGHGEVGGGQGGVAFSHWLREDLALDFQFLATDFDVHSVESGSWESTEARGSLGFLFGARYYFPKATFGRTFRPYAAAALGPFSEYYVYESGSHDEVRHEHTRFGGQLGGGIDFQFNPLFSIGVRLGVTLRDGYDPSFGTTFGIGFAWGNGCASE